MKEELNEKLFHEFPVLFMESYGSKPKTPLNYWGVECGDGWFQLIHSVSALLSRHNPKIQVEQVKEKFAGLRLYLNHYDQYAGGVVSMAEHLSFQICEACGAPGIKRDQEGYFSTTCDKHGGRKSKTTSKDWLARAMPIEGIGNGWLRLTVGLKDIVEWYVEKNGMPPVMDLTFKKGNGQLHVEFSGGDERTRGMADLIEHYSKKIDEDTGCVLDLVYKQ